MKRFSYILLPLFLLAIGACKKDKTDSSVSNYTATLSGASEETPTGSTATGSATGTYNATTKELVLTITYSGITPVAGHIHKGAAGVSGPVIFPFASITSPVSFSTTLDAAQEADLMAGLYYINFHTAAFPGGEIRGQLLKK